MTEVIKKLIIMASILLKVRNFVEEFYKSYINKAIDQQLIKNSWV